MAGQELEIRQKQIGAMLIKSIKGISSVLPAHMDANRFCRMALNAVMRNPDLAKCDPNSFALAVINCAEMGLEPALGQAALVPFGGKVQCQAMYQGLIHLALNSGSVLSISAEVVRVGDKFDHVKGLEPKIEHRPCDNIDGKITHAYAIAKLASGASTSVVLTGAEIDKVKASVKSNTDKADSPWKAWPEEMAKKTAIKRLMKLLPKSIEMRRAVDLDNQAQAGIQQIPQLANLDDCGLDLSNLSDNAPAGMQAPKAKEPKAKAKAKPEPEEAEVLPPETKGEAQEDPIEMAAGIEEKLPAGAIKRARAKVGVDENDCVGDLAGAKAALLCVALREEALDASIEV